MVQSRAFRNRERFGSDGMSRRARIALLIDTATTWGTGLIEGIAEYAHTHEDWQFLLGPRGKYDRSLLPADWSGDGIIARITHQVLADQLATFHVPVVNVSWYQFDEPLIPRCTTKLASTASPFTGPASWIIRSSSVTGNPESILNEIRTTWRLEYPQT